MRPSATGLIHHDPGRTSPGYTLFSSGSPASAWLIDMDGRFVHRWQHPGGIQYAQLLDTGHLLCRAPPSENVEGQRGLNGQSAALFELDWDGNEVWRFEHDWLHHDHARLSNGNTLALQWRYMDAELSARIQGGYTSDTDGEQMLGDVILELDAQAEVVREWRSWDHLDPETDIICPIDHRMEWTHANSISETPDGRWIISFRRIDTIAVIEPDTGEIAWRGGPGLISHQHDARMLANGNITAFDNGVHRRGGAEFSQAVEIDPEANEIVWRYQSDPPFNLFTFMGGSMERLAGTSLICQTQAGRMFEVTQQGETVWEYVNPFFVHNPRLGGRMNMVFKAHRYGPDFAAFVDRDLDPARFANLNRLYAET